MDNAYSIVAEIERLVVAEDAGGALARICALLNQEVSHYNWVGYYIAYPAEQLLVLGPFEGEPTEHIRIPYGRGICGQSAVTEQALWVDDVNAEGNYLACSVETAAEVVIPVFFHDEFVGELDIDSHTRSPFDGADKILLERVCELTAPLVARLARALSGET